MTDFGEYQKKMHAEVARVMGIPYSMFVVSLPRENVFEDMVVECQRITGRSYRVSSAGVRRLLAIAMTRPVSISMVFGEWRRRVLRRVWGRAARYGEIFLPIVR